jgi:LuxR family maltose regulon positive regulatory protein
VTGGHGGERILQELAAVNAFVVPLDAGRSWFRYHHLFAELLQLELRSTDPGELPALHRAAARWFAEHGYPVEAVRHAQAAADWGLAARLLSDNWLPVTLDGQQDTAHELLAGFPSGVATGDPELIALAAADELNRGSFGEAERHLARATRELGAVPAERRGRFQVMLGILRLSLARQRGDLPVTVEEAQRLLAPAADADGADLGMSGERRALALISLGIAETLSSRSDEAERHLERGVALARQIGRPYLELTGLAHAARIQNARSPVLGAQRSLEAIELAERHGWSEEPILGVVYVQLAGARISQGRLEEAERTLHTELEPAVGQTLHWLRGALELARGHPERALDAFRAAERVAGLLRSPYANAAWMRAHALQNLVRLGQTDRVETALAEMDEQQRNPTFMRAVMAALRLAGDDPRAATVALAPAIADSDPAEHPIWPVEALLLEAVARDALGNTKAAGRAIERALDLAEPDHAVLPFLFHPEPELLQRHARRTAHAALIGEILSLLPGGPGGPAGVRGDGPPGSRGVWMGSLPPTEHCASRSARPKPGSCATCPPACPCRRSPTSSTCR